MEQAPALTMSDKTQPPTREATPGPKADAAAAKPADAAAAATDAAPATDAADAATTAARSSADTIRPAAEGAAPRTQLNGLYSGSLEEEVGQVMKGLGSFWGGLKKKVGSDGPGPGRGRRCDAARFAGVHCTSHTWLTASVVVHVRDAERGRREDDRTAARRGQAAVQRQGGDCGEGRGRVGGRTG